jgi:hypothetical protein
MSQGTELGHGDSSGLKTLPTRVIRILEAPLFFVPTIINEVEPNRSILNTTYMFVQFLHFTKSVPHAPFIRIRETLRTRNDLVEEIRSSHDRYLVEL